MQRNIIAVSVAGLLTRAVAAQEFTFAGLGLQTTVEDARQRYAHSSTSIDMSTYQALTITANRQTP